MPKTIPAVERFEAAVLDYAWKGAQMPEYHYAIEREYHTAKTCLYQALGVKYVYPLGTEED